MKHLQIVLVGLTTVLLLARCGQPAQNAPAASPSADTTDVILVFADLTTSTDSSHIETLAQNVYNIIVSSPHEAKVKIYPIDRSPSVAPIAVFTVPPLPGTYEKSKLRDMVVATALAAYKRVRQLYTDVYASAHTESISCLIRSLETAHNHFSQDRADSKPYRFELIYLSDMVEECDDTPGGAVHMTKGNFHLPADLQSYAPAFKLNYAHVSIVISTQGHVINSPAISPEDLKVAWRAIFQKVGFTQAQIEGMGFVNSLPPRFHPDNSPWR